MTQPITLAQALVSLRKDIELAREKAENENLQFKVEEIDVEFKVTSTGEYAGEFGGSAWVLSVKGQAKLSDQTSHTVRLKLKPELQSGDDVKVGGTVPSENKS
ncbi:MAG: hypothetical protein K0U68_03460 [Gammaproteobacteria bacterium]|nr:hypothetical protein [Gammaproteobacteria bacterium]